MMMINNGCPGIGTREEESLYLGNDTREVIVTIEPQYELLCHFQ